MSPDDITTFYQGLVDDEPDRNISDVLMDVAYTKRNAARFWSFLLALDTSITQGSGDTWQTTHNLPANFDEPYRVFGGAGGQNEYQQVPYDDILNWISSPMRYAIDYVNSQMRFTGGAAQTIYMWYKKLPTSLIGLTEAQKAATTTVLWPKQFCPILAFDMAQIQMGGIDADDIARPQAQFMNAAHRELYNSMIAWDTKRHMKARDNSAAPLHGSNMLSPADVVDIP